MPISKVTTGSITDSVAIDTDTLVVDGTNNRVGVGTNNPYVNLESYVSATGAIPTNETVGVSTGNSNIAIGAFNANNSATFSGIALETRTSGASRWLIANEWKNTYVGDLVFHNRNGGTTSQESMRIDSSGRVTMPAQPAFNAINGPSPGITTADYALAFTTAVTNVGGHYNISTYRFTAPVAGTYFFMHNAMSNGGYNRTRYKKNGAYVGNEFFSGNVSYSNFLGSIVITLAINDYIEIWNDVQGNGQGDVHSNYRAFSGFLIG